MIDTVYLPDILDQKLFSQMVSEGYVRVQQHPTQPLSIANYAEKTVFNKEWNEVTRQCRGLIYNSQTSEIIARPFQKFFNHNESTAPVIGLNTPVTVTDKQDGSLGILYRDGLDSWAVATRGSFTSDQAEHATALYRRKYWNLFKPLPSITYLFEIIYPENRIVVDYQALDDLVLLGAVDIATGKSIGPDVIQDPERSRRPWPGPVTQIFDFGSYKAALSAPPRRGMEGLVVHDHLTDERVKIKQEDYVVLHRLVTGLSARRVHEAMLSGQDLDEFIAPLPDEFHDWVREVAGQIEDKVRIANQTIDLQWKQVVAECEARSPEDNGWPISISMGMGGVPTRAERALFASIASQYSYNWALFSRLDGKDYQTKLLKLADPGMETPQGRNFTEETA